MLIKPFGKIIVYFIPEYICKYKDEQRLRARVEFLRKLIVLKRKLSKRAIYHVFKHEASRALISPWVCVYSKFRVSLLKKL